jgi:predicted nucleic acid-binding protein
VRVFFDSSAFVKRYVSEPGTNEVLDWCEQAMEIGLSAIALPEIVSAFRRLQRERKINDTLNLQLKSLLLADVKDASICDLTPIVLAQAVKILEKSTLRGMDAIHIGSAVTLQADVFVSADQRQRDAAKLAGLRVEAV